ncbi:transposase family protein [Streptomyces sp. NPDC059590]|uniref:transposase family protein n=1 Tax=Streptomyces sp. NPDC059590 TaxID=3346877 RepID=UPI0036768734
MQGKPRRAAQTLADLLAHLGASGKAGIIDGTEIRVRRPTGGRKDRDEFISRMSKQNAVKAMVTTDENGRVLFCSSTKPGRCTDITHARQSGLVKLLVEGPRRRSSLMSATRDWACRPADAW